jgi:hypothetical protein
MQYWYQHYNLRKFSAFVEGSLHHVTISCCEILLSTFLLTTFFETLVMVRCIISPFLAVQYWYQYFKLPQFSAFSDGVMHRISIFCCEILVSTLSFATIFSLW